MTTPKKNSNHRGPHKITWPQHQHQHRHRFGASSNAGDGFLRNISRNAFEHISGTVHRRSDRVRHRCRLTAIVGTRDSKIDTIASSHSWTTCGLRMFGWMFVIIVRADFMAGWSHAFCDYDRSNINAWYNTSIDESSKRLNNSFLIKN